MISKSSIFDIYSENLKKLILHLGKKDSNTNRIKYIKRKSFYKSYPAKLSNETQLPRNIRLILVPIKKNSDYFYCKW